MIGDKIGHRLDPYLFSFYHKILGANGTPNLLTFLGLLAMLLASFLVIQDHWVYAGLAIILSGIFDLFDGVIARRLNKVTRFGGFFDSVVDRYSDLLFLFALLLFYLEQNRSDLVILVFVVATGTVLVSYARARAEAAQVTCNIGLMERAERLILLVIGTLFHVMVPVLWILAILTHVTVLQRIYHVWKKLKIKDQGQV